MCAERMLISLKSPQYSLADDWKKKMLYHLCSKAYTVYTCTVYFVYVYVHIYVLILINK